MMLLRLAWRNLWRNPRRTLITGSAMAFATGMMVVTVALMNGMAGQMERYATILGPGHIQIHHPDFLDERSIYDGMEKPDSLLEDVEKRVRGTAAPRAFATALASSGLRSAGAQLWGVDSLREARVTDLARHLEKGRWLSAGAAGDIILGTGLARTLGVLPGDEVVLLTQAADGSLGNALFRVAGILRSLGEAMDRSGILLPLGDLDELAVLEGRVHEIAVRLEDPGTLEGSAGALGESPLLQGLSVKTWKEVLPEIAELLRLYDVSQAITLLIIFSAAALIIMDTQLMALFERTREIGVLRALGMEPGKVAVLVLLETAFLSLLALAVGLVGGILGSWSLRDGWDLSAAGGSFSFSGVTFEPVLRAVLKPSSLILPTLVLLGVSLASTVYPVFRAARVSPMAAIREAGR